MSKRLKQELREMLLSLLGTGEATGITARDLKRVGLEIKPPSISPSQVARIRESLGFSQDVFAQVLGVSKIAVSKWERGSNPPSGATAVLLKTIERDPTIIKYRLGLED